ncbi:MAG: hypothetical protein ACLPUO_28130 [Streptosporangiaceae bacterium]
MHADRTNRVVLALFGLLVLLAGAAGLIASTGGFGAAFARRALFANRVGTYVGGHGIWLWPVAAAVCLLIALAALRWILALLISTDRAGTLTIPAAADRGTTVLQPAALTGAVTREIEGYHGVAGARARLVGDPADPELVVSVTARPAADLAALHRRLEAEALAHARQALGKPALPIQLDLDVSRRAG